MSVKVFKINDLVSADMALSQIAELAREVQKLEAKRDAKISATKLEFKEDLLVLNEKIEQFEMALHEFAESNKELFEEPRSRVLSFGVIGFHEGTRLETLKKWTWKKVVVKLLKLKKRSALRFKAEANKDKLKKWSKEDLSEIGVKKVTEDHFSYALKDDS